MLCEGQTVQGQRQKWGDRLKNRGDTPTERMVVWTTVVVVAVLSSDQILDIGISHLTSVLDESWALCLESLT